MGGVSPKSRDVLITHWSYRKTSSISRTKFQSLNVSCVLLQLSLLNPLKPGVQLRMKMWLEQRRQAMLQIHLSYQQFNCLLRCDLYKRFYGSCIRAVVHVKDFVALIDLNVCVLSRVLAITSKAVSYTDIYHKIISPSSLKLHMSSIPFVSLYHRTPGVQLQRRWNLIFYNLRMMVIWSLILWK